MKKIFTILFALLIALSAYAQDPQYSQYYAAPLYINPALAGGEEYFRVGLNYRNQWPNLEANFTTYSAYADYYVEDINSGIGIMFNTDQVAEAGYRSQDINLLYAYELNLNTHWTLRAGMGLSYVMRDYNFSKVLFGDQFNASTGGFDMPTLEQFPNDRRSYLNTAAGVFLYSDRYWVGFSARNMNRPRQDIVALSNAPNDTKANHLSVHYAIQAGMKIPLVREHWREKYRDGYREKTITPTFLYKKQGSFDQFDIGAYFTYTPIVFGLWYRGIPLKEYEIGIGNNESLIALVGIEWDKFEIGYSYDYTISALGARSGGAHEFSLRIEFDTPDRRGHRKRTHRNNFPCPHF
jgi:type IX secretion system PorP/SprF family membrane protein